MTHSVVEESEEERAASMAEEYGEERAGRGRLEVEAAECTTGRL